MSPKGRALAGMPLELADRDDEYAARFGRQQIGPNRFEAEAGPWWRPSSTAGRVFLGLGAALVLAGCVSCVFAVKTYLSRDSRFRIAGAGSIEATGLTQVSRAEMLPVFGEDIGRNVFFVPLRERRKQLEAIPWVEHATVMRLLPDRIRISIVEREPVAFVRQGQQIGLVDAEGVLLSMPAAGMAKHHYSFPVVTGIDGHDPLPARRVRMAVYERLLAELDANNQHLSEQISEIDLSDPQDARVSMSEQGRDILAHLGDDQFLDRYQRYKTHIAEWRQQYPKLVAVDLRYESQVVLEMTSGTTAVAATVSDGGPETSLVAAPAVTAVSTPAKPAAGTVRAARPVDETAANTPAKAKPVEKDAGLGAPVATESARAKAGRAGPGEDRTGQIKSEQLKSAQLKSAQAASPRVDSAQIKSGAKKPGDVRPALAYAAPIKAATSAKPAKPAMQLEAAAPAKVPASKMTTRITTLQADNGNADRIEMLAARQRASRERAARAKAAREKRDGEKKQATSQHAAMNVNAKKPTATTSAAAAVAQGG